jgi:hypothetical protein
MASFQSLDAMLFAIGRAIHEYQFVEDATLRVLQAPFEDHLVAEIAFFHLQGKSRIRFMDKVLAEVLSSEDWSRWVRLRNALETCGSDRNAFAHHQIVYDGNRPVIKPSMFDWSRFGDEGFSDPNEEPYYIVDVYQSVKAFRALTAELKDFAESIDCDDLLRAGRKIFPKLRTPPQPWSLPATRRSKAHRRRQQQRADEARRARSKTPKG